MNMICDLIRPCPPSGIRRGPAVVLAGFLLAALLVSGCSKSKPAATPMAASAADTNPAAAQMPQVPAATPEPVEVAANPDGGVDIKAMNHAYIGWIMQTRRAPKSFEDYVAQSGVKFPPPPAGKKFVIDHNGFINLANK